MSNQDLMIFKVPQVMSSDEAEELELGIELANQLGQIIRAERKRQGISQREMARRVGREQRAWSNWEKALIYNRGGATPSTVVLRLPLLLRIEKALGLPKTALLQRLFPEWLKQAGVDPWAAIEALPIRESTKETFRALIAIELDKSP